MSCDQAQKSGAGPQYNPFKTPRHPLFCQQDLFSSPQHPAYLEEEAVKRLPLDASAGVKKSKRLDSLGQ